MSYAEDNKKLLESLPENTKFVHTPGQTWYSLDNEPITDVIVSEYVTPGTFRGKAQKVVNNDTLF